MENENLIINKLDLIKAELDYIKNHMVDVDTILTSQEESRLNESLEEFSKGKTSSLEEVEKERKNGEIVKETISSF